MSKVPPLPEAELKRLKARETAQRRQTREMSKTSKTLLRVEPVSIEGLWLLSGGVCMCDARCGPLVPGADDGSKIIIGHAEARRFGGHHTVRNVILQRDDCNQRATSHENNRKRVETKFIPDKSRPKKNTIKPRSKLPTKADKERVLRKLKRR